MTNKIAWQRVTRLIRNRNAGKEIFRRTVSILRDRAALRLERIQEVVSLADGIYNAEIVERQVKKVIGWRYRTHILAARLGLSRKEYESL